MSELAGFSIAMALLFGPTIFGIAIIIAASSVLGWAFVHLFGGWAALGVFIVSTIAACVIGVQRK